MADSKRIFKIAVGALALSLAVLPVPLSSAFGEGGFHAGNIISDANMYQATPSMSQTEIQKFLDTQGADCNGSGCLKDLHFDTKTFAPDDYCPGEYQGANNEPVSQIIYKVSQACQINPKVLLVTIQKEQSGLTKNLTTASQGTLMGYGCPDRQLCNQLYLGVQNQIYRAARQFQRYRLKPTDYTYRADKTKSISYSSNSDCGASEVTIENQATASLYNYTPHQPNQALLSGGRDSCSSDGNYNFFNMYSKWFGDPRSSVPATPASTPITAPEGGNTGSASNTRQQAAQEADSTQPAATDNSQNQQTDREANSAANGAANPSSATVSNSLDSTDGTATSSASTAGTPASPTSQSGTQTAGNAQENKPSPEAGSTQTNGAQDTTAQTRAQSTNNQSTAQNESQTATPETEKQPQKTLPTKQANSSTKQGKNPGLASTGTVGGSVALLAIALIIAGWRIRKNVIDNRPIRVNC